MTMMMMSKDALCCYESGTMYKILWLSWIYHTLSINLVYHGVQKIRKFVSH